MHASKGDIEAVKVRDMRYQIHEIRTLVLQLASIFLISSCSKKSDIPLPKRHAPSSHTKLWLPGRCENIHSPEL